MMDDNDESCSVCGLEAGSHRCQYSACQREFASELLFSRHLGKNWGTCGDARTGDIRHLESLQLLQADSRRSVHVRCDECNISFDSVASKQAHDIQLHSLQDAEDGNLACSDCMEAFEPRAFHAHVRSKHAADDVKRLVWHAEQQRRMHKQLSLGHSAFDSTDVSRHAIKSRPTVYPSSSNALGSWLEADKDQQRLGGDDGGFHEDPVGDVVDQDQPAVPDFIPAQPEDGEELSSDEEFESPPPSGGGGAQGQRIVDDALLQLVWPPTAVRELDEAKLSDVSVQHMLVETHAGGKRGTRVLDNLQHSDAAIRRTLQLHSVLSALPVRARDDVYAVVAELVHPNEPSVPACPASNFLVEQLLQAKQPIPTLRTVQLPTRSAPGIATVHYVSLLDIIAVRLQALVDCNVPFATPSDDECRAAAATHEVLCGRFGDAEQTRSLRLKDIEHMRPATSVVASAVAERSRQRFKRFIDAGFVNVNVVFTRDEAFVFRKQSEDFFRVAVDVDPTLTYLNLCVYDSGQIDFNNVGAAVLLPGLAQLRAGVRVQLRDRIVPIVGDLICITADKLAFVEMLGVNQKQAVHIPATPGSIVHLGRLDTDVGAHFVDGSPPFNVEEVVYRNLTAQKALLNAAKVALEAGKPQNCPEVAACRAAHLKLELVNIVRPDGSVMLSLQAPFIFDDGLSDAISVGTAGFMPGDSLHQVWNGIIDHHFKRVGRSIGWEDCQLINSALHLLPPPPSTCSLDSWRAPRLYSEHVSKQGKFYNIKTDTQSSTQRRSKIYVFALILFELNHVRFAAASMRLAVYDLTIASAKTTIGELRQAQLKYRSALRLCPFALPESNVWSGYKNAVGAEAERYRLRFNSYNKWVDERVLVDRVATGAAHVTSTSKSEAQHQPDKDTGRNHSANRQDLTPQAILNRHYVAHALATSDGSAFASWRARAKRRHLNLCFVMKESRAAVQRLNRSAQFVAAVGGGGLDIRTCLFNALRVMHGADEPAQLPTMRFLETAVVLRAALHDGTELTGRVFAAYNNGTQVVVMDEMSVPALFPDDFEPDAHQEYVVDGSDLEQFRERYLVARCRPLQATGHVLTMLLDDIDHFEALMVTDCGLGRERRRCLRPWQPPPSPLACGELCTWHVLIHNLAATTH